MVRDQSYFVMERLGLILAHILKDRQTLLVASTDLSHFYPQAIANKLDHELLRQVEAFSPTGVIQAEENGKGFACGRGALDKRDGCRQSARSKPGEDLKLRHIR